MKTVKNPGKRTGSPGGRVRPGDLVTLEAETNYGTGIVMWSHDGKGVLWRCLWNATLNGQMMEWDELDVNLVVVQSVQK